MEYLRSSSPGIVRSHGRCRRGAFTLVEMLVVMGIMVVLLALLAPAATTILSSSNLTQSGNKVSDQFVLARQMAIASNRRVQVRFYNLPVATVNGTTSYCAMQIFKVEENGTTTPLNKLQRLNNGIIFVTDSGNTVSPRSTLLGTTVSLNGTTTLAAYGNQACPYVGFQFLPDGSTDLDPTANSAAGGWLLTMVEGNKLVPATGPPVNFCTVRVDPINGRVQTFRP